MAQGRDDEEWNVLAIATRGATGKALALLGSAGRFRTGGYPQVLIGKVPRPAGDEDLLAGLDGFDSDEQRTEGVLDRLIPVERAVSFVRDDVTETLCEHLEPLAPRLCGKSFFVRTHLRGLKGRVEHPAAERALGEFLFEFAARSGAAPSVTFRDPDFVVAIEVVGRRAGFAFLGRHERAQRLVRIR